MSTNPPHPDPPHKLHGSLWEALDDSEIQRYGNRCHWQSYPSDTTILRHSDSDSDVLFIQSGLVRATAYSPEGRPVVFRDIGPGEIVGDFAAIDEQPRSANVHALEDSLVARMPRAVFLELLERHPACMRVQLRNLVSAIREMSDKLYALTALNANTRIRAYLMRQAHKVDPNAAMVTLPTLPPQGEIATLLGTQREVVSKELRRLQADSILTRHADQYLLDIEKLEKLIGLI